MEAYAELEGYLRVLAHSNRLELLDALRQPRTLDEIHLVPTAAEEKGSAERNMSRQGVQNHLNKLIDAGIVRVGRTSRKGKRGVLEYHLDTTRVFAVVEELRKLTFQPAAPLVDPLATQKLPQGIEEPWPEGPKLVLVHGVREGRAFPLRQTDLRPPRGWVVGRAPDVPVCLEYDPFVSLENAEILPRSGGGFRILDLRSAKNGTYLNWHRLPPGGEAPLEPGDIVGVGRTFLVFRPR